MGTPRHVRFGTAAHHEKRHARLMYPMPFMSAHEQTYRASMHASTTNPPIGTFPEVRVGFHQPFQTSCGSDREQIYPRGNRLLFKMGRGQGTSR